MINPKDRKDGNDTKDNDPAGRREAALRLGIWDLGLGPRQVAVRAASRRDPILGIWNV